MPKRVLPAIKRRLMHVRRAASQASTHLLSNLYPFSLFQDAVWLEDNTLVTLYTDDDGLFPHYAWRTRPASAARQQTVKVTLIATVRNEESNIETWMASILQQTRLPDEIIITETGSSDNTYQRLIEHTSAMQSRSHPISVRILQLPGANIAQGRNHAIRHASHAVIAVTDFGVHAHHDWLERLAAPFEIDPAAEVSGGWYRAVDAQGQPIQAARGVFWRNLLSAAGDNPQNIQPPGACVAFTRQSWEKVGGFPEWLTLTGEDSYFDLELRRCTQHWAFVPQALVDWQAPQDTLTQWRKLARWSSGDGETGLHAAYYRYAFLQLAWTAASLGFPLLLMALAGLTRQALFAWLGTAVFLAWLVVILWRGWRRGYGMAGSLVQLGNACAQAVGFLIGAKRRRAVTRRRLAQVRGFFFILAGVPIDDTGGGSRFAQFAQEMLRQGYAVIYLHKFPKGETTDLKLHIRHPNLFHAQIKEFSLQRFIQDTQVDFRTRQTAALVEVPLPDWLPLLKELTQQKAPIIYDLLDNWTTDALGGGWYSPAVEQQIVQQAQILVATAPSLVERLEQISGKPITLLPNAVNLRLFNPKRHTPRPLDMPDNEFILIYTGALYGDWFDWELLLACADAYPHAGVVIIGDYHGQCPRPAANLHFLGLKKQVELPAYLSHASVAIIPWKVDATTLATSPLKVYEYLAMCKPVVAPHLPPLLGLPGVYCAADQADFVRSISTYGPTYKPADQTTSLQSAFLQQNSWEARLQQINALLQANPQ